MSGDKQYVTIVAGGYYLGKDATGEITLIDSKGKDWSKAEIPTLSEQEIKTFDKRYWLYAKEVL